MRSNKGGAGRGSNRCRRQFPAILLPVLLCVVVIAGCGSSASTLMVQVNPNTTQMVDEGQQLIFMASLSDNNTRGVTWTLTGAGCAGTGCGVLSNVTTTSVTYTAPTGRTSTLSVSLEAAAISAPSVNVTVAITVVLPPTFTTLTLPNGANGVPYNQTIVVTGGVQPLKFTIPAANGMLPSGLSLNNTGTITGDPQGPGTQPNPELFTVVVTDNGSVPLSVTSPQYSINISPAPILSVTSSGALPPATVNSVYSTRIQTTGGTTPFSWSVPSGTLPPGLRLDPVSGIISGTPTTPGTSMFQPQVQDSSIPHQTKTSNGPLSITVSEPQPLVITTGMTLPNGAVATPYSSVINVTGGVPPYTWSLVSGQLPSGLTLNPGSGQITGTPVLATTAEFKVQVQDSETVPAQTMPTTFTITIGTGTANPNLLLSGSYAFLYTGFDTQGAVIESGVFTANGSGIITSGVEDLNRTNGVVLGATLTGTYAMNNDGTGTMELVASNQFKVVVTSDFQIVLDSEGNLRLFENDTNNLTPPPLAAHGAGIIKLQSGSNFATADFNGNYAFGFTGQDFSMNPASLAGFVHADGNTNLSPGMADFNDAGTYNGQLPLNGSFSVLSTTGRGSASMVFAALGSPQMVLQFTFYMVSQTELFFIEADVTDATHPRIAGEMQLQNTGVQFNAASLTGGSIVSGAGLDTKNPSAFVGRLLPGDAACGFAPALSLTADQNDGGTITGPTSTCGTYTVQANGRAGFTNLSPRVAAAYLTDQNQGFLIGSDSTATLGLLEAQTPEISFTTANIQGGYTLSAPVIAAPSVNNILGQLSCLLGTGTMTGTVNEIAPNGTPGTSSTTLLFTVTDAAKGRGIVSVSTTKNLLPATLAFYIVSPSKIRMVSSDASDKNPQVIFLDH
ncbi:MAG: Ig domain-containing protein [Candidatus Acidiferrales bacterium]